MKTFKTSGTGSGQSLSEIESERIPIYQTVADAEADLANLEEGQIVMTPDEGAEELLHPVAVVEKDNTHAVQSEAVANALSYFLEEHFTGKYFLDGKKIYRKCYIETNAGDWSNNQTIDTIANFESYVASCLNALFQGTRNTYFSNMMIDSSRGLLAPNASGEIKVNLSGTVNTVKKWGWIEYTKTTD